MDASFYCWAFSCVFFFQTGCFFTSGWNSRLSSCGHQTLAHLRGLTLGPTCHLFAIPPSLVPLPAGASGPLSIGSLA